MPETVRLGGHALESGSATPTPPQPKAGSERPRSWVTSRRAPARHAALAGPQRPTSRGSVARPRGAGGLPAAERSRNRLARARRPPRRAPLAKPSRGARQRSATRAHPTTPSGSRAWDFGHPRIGSTEPCRPSSAAPAATRTSTRRAPPRAAHGARCARTPGSASPCASSGRSGLPIRCGLCPAASTNLHNAERTRAFVEAYGERPMR